MAIFNTIQKTIAAKTAAPPPKPAAAPTPAAPPPAPPRVSVPQHAQTNSSFESGGNRTQSWQRFTANPDPTPVSSTPTRERAPATFRVIAGTVLDSGLESALRARSFSMSAEALRAGPQSRTTGARASSLLTESIGDSSANCLEQAYTAAGPNDSVTLLNDKRDPTGHAVVERTDGTVFDPATQRSFGSMDAYLAQNQHYELRPEPEARRIPRSTLEQVFNSPPNSPARAEALKAAGLTGIAGVSVADDPPTAQEALEQIKELLTDGTFTDVTHADLLEIEDILRSLPPDQVNTVISRLSDDEIEKWIGEMNSGGILGTGGLSDGERASLFGLLSDTLDTSQASRYFQALDRPEQMMEFGEAFLDQASPQDRLGFLRDLGCVSFPDNERWASGRIIAAGLDSLTSDPGLLATAVRSLSEQNLQDGLIAAAGIRFNDSINTPFGAGQYQLENLDRLQRITDALASTEDYGARAAVFDGMGYILREFVRGDRPTLFPEEAADRVAGMMTSVISDDLPAILGELSGANGRDPLGTAMTAYVREQLRDGGGQLPALVDQIRTLNIGDPGASGRFDNAFLSGYFAGAVFKAVDTLSAGDLLGPNYNAMMAITQLVVAFRTDPATGILLGGALTEAERASIDRAMNEGGAAVREALLQTLGVDLSPGNDNGTAVGAFEQGLFAVYGSELYGDD